MSISMFTQLLDSYEGIRKRAWIPALSEVGNKGFNWTKNLVADTGGKFFNLDSMQKVVQAGSTAASLEVAKSTVAQGVPVVFNNSVYFMTNKGASRMLSSQRAYEMIEYWKGQSEGEPHPDTRMGDKPQGEGAPEEGEPGFIEKQEEPLEDEEEAPPDPAEELRQQAIDQRVTFSEGQREDALEFLRKQKNEDGELFSKEEAEEEITMLENTINTPNSQTNLWKGLVDCMGKRPDYPLKIKQQMLNCAASIMSLSNKVQKVEIDGQTVLVIRAEKITEDESAVRKLTTLRGQTGTRTYFGRNTEFLEGFKELQEFVSDYDDDNGYGTSFGKAFGRYTTGLWGVRVLDKLQDTHEMTREDYDDLEHSVRRSRDKEAGKASNGAPNLGNDWRGKLTEDVIELNTAMISGDEAAVKKALDTLRTRIEQAVTFSTADLEHLEGALLGSEFEGLLDFSRLEALGVPPNALVRQYLMQAAVHTETFFRAAGISKENVKKVDRPSQESSMGYKSDIDVYLKPGTVLSPDFHGIVHTDKDGNLVLSISVKDYSELNSPTEMGTASLARGYGTDPANRIAAEVLLTGHLERALASKAMTPDDVDACRKALYYDRAIRKAMTDKFKSFTGANTAEVKAYLTNLMKAWGTVGNEEHTTSVAAQLVRDKHIKEIQDNLDDPDKGPVMAAIKLFNLQRIARAQSDPAYGRAVAFNDAVFSCGTYEDEAFMRGSPGRLTTGSYHQMHDSLARVLFKEGGEAKFTLGSTTIVDSDGDKLFKVGTRAKTASSAKQGRKEIAAANLLPKGRKKLMKTHPSIVGEKQGELETAVQKALGLDVEDEEQQEPLVGSALYPILQQLPAKETGKMHKVGEKIIIVHHPFCLKVKLNGHEFEGGFPSKNKALDALDLIRQLAKETDEKIDAKVEDYDAGRTLS